MLTVVPVNPFWLSSCSAESLQLLGDFYLKKGQRARLPSELASLILRRLDAASAALPAWQRLLDWRQCRIDLFSDLWHEIQSVHLLFRSVSVNWAHLMQFSVAVSVSSWLAVCRPDIMTHHFSQKFSWPIAVCPVHPQGSTSEDQIGGTVENAG